MKRRRARGVDVWSHLDRRVDVVDMRPELRTDLDQKEFPLRGGGTYVLMANREIESYLRMNGYEAAIARRMDGTRTVAEIAVDHLEGSGELDLDGVIDLVIDLHKHGLLVRPFLDVDAILRRRVAGISARKEKVDRFLKTQTIEWKGADPLLRRLYQTVVRRAMQTLPLIVMSVVSLVGLVGFFFVVASHRFSLAQHSLAQEGIILILMNLLLITLHELGHAMTIIHFGRHVNGVGAQIYFGSLVFFIDSTDALMLDRRHRMIQSAAGAFTELTVAGVATLVMLVAPGLAFSTVLYKFAVLNYFVIFLNLVPFLELDGYWILSDLLRIPDLRARSIGFLRHDLIRKLRAREPFDRSEMGMALYAVLGSFFTVFAVAWSLRFWRSIFGPPLGRMWRAGTPTRVLVVVLVALIAAPLLRGLVKLATVLGRKARIGWEIVVFRLQRGWRVEAAELVDALPLFEDLDTDELEDLAGRVGRRFASAMEPVVSQGEYGTSFFVVRRGTLDVVDIDALSGDPRVVRTLTRGDSFGEIALMTGQPRRATVRARSDADLFEVDKGTFDRILASHITAWGAGPTMQDLREIRELPAFKHLEAVALMDLLRHGQWVDAESGGVLVKAGDVGDAFYAIRSGQAEVVRNRTRIGTLGPGDHFGELSLLTKHRRAATVRALTPLVAYRVDRVGFDRLLRSAFRKGRLRPTVVGARIESVG